MKTRRHHNNDGRRQIQRGGTRFVVKRLAISLGVPFGPDGKLVGVIPTRKLSRAEALKRWPRA